MTTPLHISRISSPDTHGREELSDVAAVTLDIDDTLWLFKRAVDHAERVLHSWLTEQAPSVGSWFPDHTQLSIYRDRVRRERTDLHHRLDLVRRESIRQLLLDAGADAELAGQGYEVFYAARQQSDLFDDVIPCLTWLSKRYPLVAITNGNSDLKASKIRGFFREVLVAHTFGCAKPDRRIFHAAADAAGVPAQQVLHIGDDFELDYLAARSAGMQAAWLVRTTNAAEVGDSVWKIQDLQEACSELDRWYIADTERVATDVARVFPTPP